MKTTMTQTLAAITLAILCAGVQAKDLAEVDTINGSDQPTVYSQMPKNIDLNVETTYSMLKEYHTMVDNLLPKLMPPVSIEDRTAPFDADKDCLVVQYYDKAEKAPRCQIVLRSGDYLPVQRGYTRFFIDTAYAQLGPYATGNLMGAPVSQPYERFVDYNELNQANIRN